MLDRFGWVAFLVALIPAVVRLPRTRSLLRHTDDPALPERLLGSRTLIAFAFSFAFVVQIIVWTPLTPLTIPLQIVAFALAGWPLRRALFAETWSFPAYLWFYVRLVVAIYGFWLLMLGAPYILNIESLRGWTAAAVLGVVLLVWNDLYGIFLRFVMRMKPVTTPALVDRFNAIVLQPRIFEALACDWLAAHSGDGLNPPALAGMGAARMDRHPVAGRDRRLHGASRPQAKA